MFFVHVVFCIAGLVCGLLLFHKVRYLPDLQAIESLKISVIIPARNEAHALPLLLSDLRRQSLAPLQIICVDDASEDETGDVAATHGAQVIRVQSKPAGWIGKSFACQVGADLANGDLLLFLDADTRLQPDAIQKLCSAHQKTQSVISVQPYHHMKKWYEELALFFNLVTIGAMSDRLPGKQTKGLYGPVILIPKTLYEAVGGHSAIRDDVLDDMSLGAILDKHNLATTRYLGGNDIQFRMYPGGLHDLAEGFTKNFASGASRTAPLALLLVALWMSALFRVTIEVISLFFTPTLLPWVLYGCLYGLLALQVWTSGKKIGSFRILSCVFYPVCLLFFLAIFLYSIYKKVFRLPVRWKGRKIEREGL